MNEKTSIEAVSEARPSAEPEQPVPGVSAEITTAFDPSTRPEDTPTGLVSASEPPANAAEPPALTRHKSLAFLQPGTQPGSLGRLGHFEVLELLGKGGFGIVLRAFDDKLERQVAIKVLGPQLTGNANARSRFVREARAAAAVNNKYVVSTYEVYEQPIPYLVMEYVAGKSLQDRLDQLEPFAPRDILRIGAEIAQGLAAAHQQGLIHRDIKPANILREEVSGGVVSGEWSSTTTTHHSPLTTHHSPRVKIADFGLARAVDDISLTQSGMVAGTPLFMSPEQACGEPLDHRSDLFSLGSVLYALCTGHPPFKAHKTLGVLKRVCDDTPRPIREVNAAIPEALAALIDWLLVKDPGGRIQTAAEVAELLQQQLAHLDDPAVPLPDMGDASLSPRPTGGEGSGVRGEPLPAVAPPLNAAAPPTTKVRRRRRLTMAGVLLSVVGGLCLAVALRDTGPVDQANEEAKGVREDKPGLEQRPKDPLEADAGPRQVLDQKLAAIPDDAAQALDLANLLLTTHWTVLQPSAMKSQGGATLTLQSDDSILASGINPDRDDYSLVARTDLQQITAIRVEALPDPSLPRGGPGRSPAEGNFHLNKLRLLSGGQPCPLTNIAVAYAGMIEGMPAPFHRVIQGELDDSPGWGNFPRSGKANTAVIATRITRAPDDDLKIEMHFSRSPPRKNRSLGRFRLSVSGDPAAFDREAQRFTAMNFTDPWTRLAVAYAVNGRIEEAAQAFGKALQRAAGYEDRKPIVEAAARFDGVLSALIQRQPDDSQLLLVLARQHAERGKQRLAEKQPANAQAELEKACAIFTRLPSPPDQWTVLMPVEMKTNTGARMELQKDGSVFVHQSQSAQNDIYTLEFQTKLQGIKGLRLEALANPRLPGGGPGWASNGNFRLNEMTLEANPAQNPGAARRIALTNPSADFSQTAGGGFHVRGAVDGNDRTGWAVHPEFNKDHTAVFDLAETIGDGQAARLTVRLKQGNPGIDKHQLGRFRLSFTNDATTAQATRVRLDLKDSALVDCYVALGTAYAQQGQTKEAVAAFAEALPLAADQAGKATVITRAAPLEGVLEQLAGRAVADALFQVELARHYAERGKAPAAHAARTQARALLDEKLAREPANPAWAGGLADLLVIDSAARWTVLKPAEMKAAAGATLTLEKDGAIFVSGKLQNKETYTLDFNNVPGKIRALRLEALRDERLPKGGPGTHGNGNFVLSHLAVFRPDDKDPAALKQISLRAVFASFEERRAETALTNKGNQNAGWSVSPAIGKSHYAIFAIDPDQAGSANNRLTIVLDFYHPAQALLGRFRFSVSADDPEAIVREQGLQLAATKNADPWAKLAAAYHVLGNHVARDQLLKHHPAAAAGIGDVYTAQKDWERAIAEYGKAITDQPNDVALLTRLAAAYQSAGRPREAAPYLARASAANPGDLLLAIKVAALQAWFGQEKELAATRKRILALVQGTKSAPTAGAAAKICCLAPGTDARELEAALALGHTGVKLRRDEWNLLSVGMAEYRNGNYAAADEALLAAATANPNNRHAVGTAPFYRAMSLFRQGKQDEARKLANAAAAKMKPLPKDENNPLANANHDDLILWLAYKEAKALLKVEDF